MKKLLQEAALERRLVCDGAMGTQLMLAGLEQGGSGEYWNLTHADRVLGIQRRYVEAGADCLITNTFGGSRLMLKRHGHADDLRAINQAGARIAREAFGDRTGYVLGDLGPLGAILEPYGDLP
ncbi:MAG TPA: homocysteine S-methyltransferase family protein, partial [Verrucomicrobiae bacterium]